MVFLVFFFDVFGVFRCFFVVLLMFCISIRNNFLSRLFIIQAFMMFLIDPCVLFFLSRLTFGYLSQSLHQKIQYSRFFSMAAFSVLWFFFMFRFSIRSFWSFFLFVFSILRCIFVIYRGDLREKKYFRNQDMFTLQWKKNKQGSLFVILEFVRVKLINKCVLFVCWKVKISNLKK